METIKAGNKGYGAEITVVTYSERKKETDERSKFRILLSFGQHGRELITTELALRILSILSGEQSLPNMDQASLNTTLDKLVIKASSYCRYSTGEIINMLLSNCLSGDSDENYVYKIDANMLDFILTEIC
ncbi:hypothetical protein Ahy_B10g102606 [Arachis hypogaea]|uniref:Peptidase M14 carboxypeptidase A domain-containing protein n=1 Tax=Arachis hypogaea TaxID=3818 RepID=A0A444X215_ARAHY|nr:hypothetical protein Ahy_B10g102606 [Arachis hypogaea]